MEGLLVLLDEMVPYWSMLGIFMGIPADQITSIEGTVVFTNVVDRMLLEWIQVKGDQATMQKIITALENPFFTVSQKSISNLKAMAKRLREDRQIQETFGSGISQTSGDYSSIRFCYVDNNNYYSKRLLSL